MLASGGIIEYTVPAPIANGSSCFGCGQASLGGIAAGADGNLWFVDSGHYKVGRITPSGVVTEFAIPAVVGGPYGITAGPDGNIWVTTNNLGQGRQDWILRISADGTVSPFQAGTGVGFSGTGPESITTGPDGNLWFTEFWTNRIGRMTPAGALTEFPLSGPDVAPRGIVSGPDGNVWFVEAHFNHTAIARITVAGVVTEYPLGGSATDQLQPTNIVTAEDGNLWFSEGHPSAPQGEVGRITPAGTVTWFPFPPGGRPNGLASGPDGNIWVADTGRGTIVRMSPSGAFRQFPLPRYGTQPFEITAGADGRMWFTEGGGRIGSIGVTVPEANLSELVLRFPSAASNIIRRVTITNDGDAALRITSSSLVGADQSEFVKVGDDCSGRVIAASNACRIDIKFNPSGGSGVRAARLAITDDATGSPQSVSLLAQLPNCRLPLFVSTSSSQTGEFLSVPDGQILADPNGAFVVASSARSQAQPVLSGTLPAAYDRAAARWVPGVVSPDGTRYAYVDYGQGPAVGFNVHVVDVMSGRDRALNLPQNQWSVLAFTADGIYLHVAYEGVGPGLWIVDPDTGSLRTLFTDSVVRAISGQTAWIGATNTSDPLPQPPGMGAGFNEVQGRDLKTSQITTWFYRSGTSLGVVSAAGSSILVGGYDTEGSYMWAVTAPDKADLITDPSTGDPLAYASAFIAAPDGWWLGANDAIYLWTARTGTVLVADATGAPAGACA